MSREFYDKEYHFNKDVEALDEKRLARFLRWFSLKRAGNYLDIGCGVGWTLNWAKRHGLKAYGLDFSIKALRLGKEYVDRSHVFIQGDGARLPFKNGSFDFVSALGVIEHFPNPQQGIDEIWRVSRYGGEIIISVPNSIAILEKYGLYKGTEQPLELRTTVEEWKILITNPGLSVKCIKIDYGPRIFKDLKCFKILARLLLKITVFLPKYFSYQFIFCCRK